VLSGAAAEGECARVSSGGSEIARVCADRAGTPAEGQGSQGFRFERILRLPPGLTSIEIKPEGHPADHSSRIEFTVDPPVAKAAPEVHWERMRPGDIVLSHSLHSEQTDLYNAVYTHAGIYFGPAPDGAALIAEAVTAADAEGLGEVRTVPIEQSLAFRLGTSVAILRPSTALRPVEERALVEFLGSVANRGLKYWSVAEDFSNMYSAWVLWDSRADRPRDPAAFERVVERLNASKLTTARFNCAGLIWRAYWTATQGRVDLATPNRAEIGGRLAGAFTPAFLARVQPYFISPDTLYRSGKLVEVQE